VTGKEGALDIPRRRTYSGPIRVILVEDHLTYRQSLRLALTTFTPIVVAGEAGSAREGYTLIERVQPDLAVIDFFLPDGDGVSMARELRRRRITTQVMILGRVGHPLFVRDAIRLGVRGYVLKRDALDDIIAAMNVVARGETYFSPGLMAAAANVDAADAAALARLTVREREILCLLSDGLTSKEIARVLCLASKTVDAHRLHINHKLGVSGPAALARLVADQGLVAG
jgi:two-component system, NarL family, nitrate/nitrite response regulator NarL